MNRREFLTTCTLTIFQAVFVLGTVRNHRHVALPAHAKNAELSH